MSSYRCATGLAQRTGMARVESEWSLQREAIDTLLDSTLQSVCRKVTERDMQQLGCHPFHLSLDSIDSLTAWWTCDIMSHHYDVVRAHLQVDSAVIWSIHCQVFAFALEYKRVSFCKQFA